MGILVLPRVTQRHPELSDDDVKSAWEYALKSAPRTPGDTSEYVAIGFDGHGRLIEMIAMRNESGEWLIYHAMTPPTKRFMAEIMKRGGKDE